MFEVLSVRQGNFCNFALKEKFGSLSSLNK